MMLENNRLELIENNPDAIIFYYTKDDEEKAWLQIDKQQYSNDKARWNAFLNLICLKRIVKWLEELNFCEKITWNNLNFWEFVNGIFLDAGDKCILIIVSEEIDNTEICVPQEWVDISSIIADYYLALQIIPDERIMCIWGYTTHLELKNHGEFDPIDRTYTLLREDLLRDINAFLVALEFCPQQREIIPDLPRISENEADYFIEKFSVTSPYLPRLGISDIDFQKFLAILENDEWRQKLYSKRVQSEMSIIKLSNWLRNIVDTGWKDLEEFPASQRKFAFRSDTSPTELNSEAEAEVQNLIARLQDNPDEAEKQIVAERLGNLSYTGKEITDAIDALVNLIKTSIEGYTLWTAVKSLQKLDPHSSMIAVGVKSLTKLEENNTAIAFQALDDLGVHLAGHQLALVVGILEKCDGYFSILAQIQTVGEEEPLPPDLKMSVFDEGGEILSELTAGEAHAAISDYLSGQRGDRFSIKVSLGENCIGKDFEI
ncbi:DUF1822 family protein [Aetokthonos hydrillicola Thurmond2011]|uniref:DUF1822 family protein n=1 Tax=Aetokthonos hydrillicola Thurmond2011 TaxID=2712845 RepID=A0AAP5IBF3_9CYAN|nr:DUF1822 family protein [Aetokthonos hydrillicola]MBO3461997.1 DUF1822 family protein [Aetokthonos hydrillicola CCALA 1050]MBW4584300.1 DUF1822 family protein [Aetokthonos hydrillicola CCALA 1050]MDR9898492.1 DUF1822 family protein [Aetokthonos hydrillicola Thurmond2011]